MKKVDDTVTSDFFFSNKLHHPSTVRYYGRWKVLAFECELKFNS